MDENNSQPIEFNTPQAQPADAIPQTQTPGPDGSYRFVPGQYAQSTVPPQGTVPPRGTVPPQGGYNVPPQEPVPPMHGPNDNVPHRKAKVKKAHRGLPTGAIIAICVAAILLVSVGTAVTTVSIMHHTSGGSVEAAQPAGEAAEETTPATPVPQLSASGVTEDSTVNQSAAYVYELAKQQVVGITTDITYYNVFGQSTSASVSGSGVIVQSDGYILTNYHVIEDAYEGGYTVSVMMYDGTEYDAEIVGFDEDSDIALLKIDAEGLNAAELGDSSNLAVGTVVYAVGNPLGELSYTMTSGIVSATDRVITTEEDVAINMFQIDAAVNSGNSGGPVYNSDGQVIGIVTAKYGLSSTGVEGLGFAIPISDAMDIANQILEYGYVTNKAAMGITPATMTETQAEQYNMVAGVYVNSVQEDSAADKAGVKQGDIITAVDDTTVASTAELTCLLRSYHAGDTATLTVWRSGEELSLQITFDEKQQSATSADSSASGEMPTDGNGNYYYYYSGNGDDFMNQFFNFPFGN